eukprot:6024597-Prymnesium_polylepis.2
MSKYTNVAGSRVSSGEVFIGARVRVRRGDEVVFNGRPVSIKHFKEEVKRVRKGSECGIILADFGEFEEGDTMSFYETVSRKVGLYDAEPEDDDDGGGR